MNIIKLMNKSLSDTEFKQQVAYLEDRLGKNVTLMVTTESFEDVLQFESKNIVKLYSRSEGYCKISLENYIVRLETKYGIH